MQRINIYYHEDGNTHPQNYGIGLFWLVEDNTAGFWVLNSRDSQLRYLEKSKYSWKEDNSGTKKK